MKLFKKICHYSVFVFFVVFLILIGCAIFLSNNLFYWLSLIPLGITFILLITLIVISPNHFYKKVKLVYKSSSKTIIDNLDPFIKMGALKTTLYLQKSDGDYYFVVNQDKYKLDCPITFKDLEEEREIWFTVFSEAIRKLTTSYSPSSIMHFIRYGEFAVLKDYRPTEMIDFVFIIEDNSQFKKYIKNHRYDPEVDWDWRNQGTR